MFAYNAELEAAIREDPDDDGRWSVLEDWILEQEDARAEFVRLSKAGDHDAAMKVTWEIAQDLLDINSQKQFAGVYAATAGCTWRAGYVDRGYFEAPSSTRMELLRELLGKRATSLMRELRVTIDRREELAELPELLAGATCKATLRRLIVATYWPTPTSLTVFSASTLAPLRLDELRFYGRALRIAYGEPLAGLRRLATCPGSAFDLRTLFDGDFPSLRELDLDLRTLEHRGWQPESIDHVLVAKNLEILRVQASDEAFAAIRERLPSTVDVKRS